jgi:hypothetical protein
VTRVYVKLRDLNNGGGFKKSLRDIATLCGHSRDTVTKTNKVLKAAGFFDPSPGRWLGPTSRDRNSYLVTTESVEFQLTLARFRDQSRKKADPVSFPVPSDPEETLNKSRDSHFIHQSKGCRTTACSAGQQVIENRKSPTSNSSSKTTEARNLAPWRDEAKNRRIAERRRLLAAKLVQGGRQTLRDLADWLRDGHSIVVSINTIWLDKQHLLRTASVAYKPQGRVESVVWRVPAFSMFSESEAS